ncbi:LacI family DNA-binding transcriptional regulator [Phycisphaerales bacterium AB-hyl4]|uniref:LacI family DNA-binding transcriptional regulator n=1 Tax=Natronomicrosphaera hydrolytica TaxID=3242702 RepID=A0ABV4U3Z3_9BACT
MVEQQTKRRGRPVSLAVIAQRAGVSMVSVSKALNATGDKTQGVSPETIVKIRRIARELGYRPNMAARILRGGKSQMIGAFLDTHAPSAKMAIVAAVEQALARHGYRMMVGQFHDSLERVRDYINDFSMRGVDGVIGFGHDYSDPTLARHVPQALAQMSNVVFVGRARLEQPYNCVTFNYTAGIHMAYDHLLHTGRKRIGMITLDSNALSPQEKLEGYRQAQKTHGHAADPALIGVLPNDMLPSLDTTREIVLRVIQQGGADALIVHSDLCARIVLRALDQSKYVVPRDLAIVSMDNDIDSQYARPSLTTIGYDIEQFAGQIVERVLALIEGEAANEEPEVRIIEPKLIVRESSSN